MKAHSIFSCLPGPHCLLSGDNSPWSPQEPAPPPSLEVHPSDVVKSKPFATEPVNLHGGLVLLKGRVNSAEVLGVGNTDLVPGKYEGGLKLWECAIDLVNVLQDEVKDGRLSFRGKRVLELGCGHGLPGVYACVKGASTVHFQDFNAEVLRSLTIPNVNANLDMVHSRCSQLNESGQTPKRAKQSTPDIHYFAGDWAKLENLLSVFEPQLLKRTETGTEMDAGDEGGCVLENSEFPEKQNTTHNGRPSNQRHMRKLSGSRACERATDDANVLEGGYDMILMSETVYSITSLPKLYDLIKKCLRPPYGVVYVAGKKHYFGVGGGTRQFKNLVEEDGFLGAHLVAEFADGSSNVREVWKFFLR